MARLILFPCTRHIRRLDEISPFREKERQADRERDRETKSQREREGRWQDGTDRYRDTDATTYMEKLSIV